MKKEKVIAHKYLQGRIPVFQTLTLWMFLEFVNASQLTYGIVGTIWGFYFVFCIYRLFSQDGVHPKELDK
jgi:hypothetical protein